MNVGSVHMREQDQSSRINKDVALAAGSALGGVVAARGPAVGHWRLPRNAGFGLVAVIRSSAR